MKTKMLRWTAGVTRMDRIQNDAIRQKFGVAPIAEKMREARLRCCRFKKVLLSDNAAPHREQVTADKLAQLGYDHMPHPPPDISPCDYHHFLGLRDFLVVRDTRTQAVLDNHIEQLTNTRPKQFWKDGIRKLAERW
ncbi:unnamed protein product [Heligmosomoides polygyrus]|uniref:Mariner Mos1 transposase n=1 Tax=Heligmosomoides polygyrus TaxID=6339 RepID=A0A183FT89_HELPZ|nr:unnamed protein product [Heligmosomoides polygyrus]